MRRRDFLKAVGGAALAGAAADLAKAAEAATPEIASLFEASSPEVLALGTRIMTECVLAKIMAPTPPLKHTWIVPGGPHYKGQWIWDTMFVVDLLSILPDKKKTIRDVFQNYWDFQDRWNRTCPACARDMVTVAIKTDPQPVRQFSQIPILAWGVERVYRRNGDKTLLKQCLPRLERFHDWYWRERDLHDNGLITVGAYTGRIQHARWETFDYECNMDDLKLTRHPTRTGPDEGAWYGDICVPGNTAYLILGERSLARLAQIVGDKGMAERRTRRAEKGVRGMRKHMWDDKAGTFLSVKRDSLEKIPVATIGSWIPLAAGVPTKAMAERDGRGARLSRLDDAPAGAHRGFHRPAIPVRRVLARRRLAAHQLPDRRRPGRLRTQRPRRDHRRQDRRQRSQERPVRMLRLAIRQTLGA